MCRQSDEMSRNLWEAENAGAVTVGSSADAARKAMFPAAMWMSRGEEAWTADSTGTQLVALIH